MTDVSLTTKGYTFTFADGEVTSINSNISASPEINTISGTGPMGGYGYDYSGTEKIITIHGVLFTTTSSRIFGQSINTTLEQKLWIESILNGTQDLIVFSSNYELYSFNSSIGALAPYLALDNSTTCLLKNATFTENNGITSHIDFILTLIVTS